VSTNASGRLTKIEYLTRDGWVVGHACVALLHPERYVERLTDHGKFGRATVLNEDLSDSDEVYLSPNLPEDRMRLVSSSTHIPRLMVAGEVQCPVCDDVHPKPFDGSCLL
jgi:hypothetical protein